MNKMENYIPFCYPTDMFPNAYCASCPYLVMPCDDVFRYDEDEWECAYEGNEFRKPEDWEEGYEETD